MKINRFQIGGYIQPSNVYNAIQNGSGSEMILGGVGKVTNAVMPEWLSNATTYISPLNYAAAITSGSIDPRVGEQNISQWHPNFQLAGRTAEVIFGPKVVKSFIKRNPKITVEATEPVVQSGNYISPRTEYVSMLTQDDLMYGVKGMKWGQRKPKVTVEPAKVKKTPEQVKADANKASREQYREHVEDKITGVNRKTRNSYKYSKAFDSNDLHHVTSGNWGIPKSQLKYYENLMRNSYPKTWGAGLDKIDKRIAKAKDPKIAKYWQEYKKSYIENFGIQNYGYKHY